MGRKYRNLHQKEKLCSNHFGSLDLNDTFISLLIVKIINSVNAEMRHSANPEDFTLRLFGGVANARFHRIADVL